MPTPGSGRCRCRRAWKTRVASSGSCAGRRGPRSGRSAASPWPAMRRRPRWRRWRRSRRHRGPARARRTACARGAWTVRPGWRRRRGPATRPAAWLDPRCAGRARPCGRSVRRRLAATVGWHPRRPAGRSSSPARVAAHPARPPRRWPGRVVRRAPVQGKALRAGPAGRPGRWRGKASGGAGRCGRRQAETSWHSQCRGWGCGWSKNTCFYQNNNCE